MGTDPKNADTDGDGLTDDDEVDEGTDPLKSDTDGDGLPDVWEVAYDLFPLMPFTGDYDWDNDGLVTMREYELGTDPKNADTDGDGLQDGWEVEWGFNPLSAVGDNGGATDPDGDGLSNAEEQEFGSDPKKADADGDGLNDAAERAFGSDPFVADADGDGANDRAERTAGTDPANPDSDYDGLPDGWEIAHGLNPLSGDGNDGRDGDPDGDGIRNVDEWKLGTTPGKKDTDGDGFTDGEEAGTVGIDTVEPSACDALEDVTHFFSGNARACWRWELPEPVTVRDVVVSNVTICASGFVCFNAPGASDVPDFDPTNRLDGGWTINRDAFTVAPYMDDLMLPYGSPPRIRVGTVGEGANAAYAIEYLDAFAQHYPMGPQGVCVTPHCSWQLTFPVGAVDAFTVTYLNVDAAASGSFASVGYQSFGGWRQYSYCYHEGGNLWTGLRLVIRPGTDTDAAMEDSDGDGLSDAEEKRLGTSIRSLDTDSDGMPDDWEVQYGLDPLDPSDAGPVRDYPGNYNPETYNPDGGGRKMLAAPVRDASWLLVDSDGDGLSNLEEYMFGTNPCKADSDGGGVDDWTEMNRHTDPWNPSDDYGNSTPGDLRPARFVVGADGSRWEMTIFGTGPDDFSVKKLVMTRQLVDVVRMIDLRKGNAYNIKMKWLDSVPPRVNTRYSSYGCGALVNRCPTNSVYRDYDPRQQSYEWDWIIKDGVVIDNRMGLLDYGTAHDEKEYKLAKERAVARIYVLGDPVLVFDYDRDGKITDEEAEIAKNGSKTFRFWINDDNDKGGGGSGICKHYNDDQPGKGHDAQDNCVNGLLDLEDFTPVWLDMRNIGLSNLPPEMRNKIKVKITSSCLNAVWTGLSRNEAKDFLCHDCLECGDDLKDDVREAKVVGLSNGEEMPEVLCNLIDSDSSKGMFLVEGKCAGDDLRVEIFLAGDVIAMHESAVSIACVSNMYRWIDLRHIAGDTRAPCATSTNEPPNRPDAECDAKHFVFVHGFNVNRDEASSNGAEIFKRLWQSGLNSRFTIVDWYGDDDQFNVGKDFTMSLNYYNNAFHAFQSAKLMAQKVDELDGKKVILAHSLGNMLVCAAAKDFNMQYNRFHMMNAAVAMEAFDEDAKDDAMVEAQWEWVTNINPRAENYRASHWSNLFGPEDFRSTLSWKGRFSGLRNVVNWYSESEEVVGDGVKCEWFLQERLKGNSALHAANFITRSWICCEGGWGVNTAHRCNPLHHVAFVGFTGVGDMTDAEAITEPLFTPFRKKVSADDPQMEVSIDETNKYVWVTNEKLHSLKAYPKAKGMAQEHDQYLLRAKLLSDGIPAESRAIGSHPMVAAGFLNRNYAAFERNETKWPSQRIKSNWFDEDERLWHHADIKNLSYYYVYYVFDHIVSGERGFE